MTTPRLGRLRLVTLATLGLAAVVDLVAFVVLTTGDPGDPGDRAPQDPANVAAEVIGAVADDDCADIGPLVDDGAELPVPLAACLDGRPTGIAFYDVEVGPVEISGGSGDVAEVDVAVAADGQAGEVLVVLRRDGDDWVVTAVRAA